MFASLLRLLALRPLLGATLLGVPLVLAIVVGLAAIWLLKAALVVVPIVAALWLLRRLLRGARRHDGPVTASV